MSQAIVGRWGMTLAVRVPVEVERAIGLVDGEPVEIEAVDGALVIRRMAALADARGRAAAAAAAAAIIEDRKKYPLGDVTVRDLIDEGRRE